MIVKRPGKVGLRLGINGVWGNMGVALAPILTGFLIAYADWRLGFFIPSIMCLLFGISQLFAFIEQDETEVKVDNTKKSKSSSVLTEGWQTVLFCLSIVTLSGGFIFGSLTFLIPRLFEVNMLQISNDVAITGLLAGLVYAIASFSQIGTGWLVDKISSKICSGCYGFRAIDFYLYSKSVI